MGQLDLDGLDRPCEEAKIEVVFDMDHNGILRVTAKDLVSGRQRSMRMVPRPPAELLQARQQLHHWIYRIERLVKEHASRFTPADLEPLKRLLDRRRAVAGREDVLVIRQAIQELERAKDAIVGHLDGVPMAKQACEIPARRDSNVFRIDMDLEI